MYSAYTVGENPNGEDLINSTNHPSTIGDDYVVYVDDITNPSAIVGYRNGDDIGIMLKDLKFLTLLY